jgi:hypothetical protein
MVVEAKKGNVQSSDGAQNTTFRHHQFLVCAKPHPHAVVIARAGASRESSAALLVAHHEHKTN